MCLDERGNISTLNGGPQKQVHKFSYLGSSISSTKNYINMGLAKAWTSINRVSVIWKSDLSDRTLTKHIEKKLDSNYTRMLQAVLNKSWRQYPTKHQLYSHLPPITKTIQISQTRHAGHCWRSKGELISDVPLWIPSHGQTKVG